MNNHHIVPVLQPNKLMITEFHDHIRYDYYLVGNIGDPEEYVDLCHALRSCGPQDQFFLRLNSGGGQVRSGNQIINALRECQGQTIGFIEHDCGSMATFLFLACSTWGVSDYAEWFSHTVSGGNYGKENETWESSQFLRKQTHKRIREEYKNFLTEDEIESILKGSDVYLNSDEIMERLENYSESLDDGLEEDFSEGVNLEEMIDSAVESGVEKALAKILKKFNLTEKEKPVKPIRKKIESKPSDPPTIVDAEDFSKLTIV